MLLDTGNSQHGIFGLAPIPFYYKMLDESQFQFIEVLMQIAKKEMKSNILEVPDERHISETPMAHSQYDMFVESINPAIGVWHGIKTNNFLGLGAIYQEVAALQNYIVSEYSNCLQFGEGEQGSINPLITKNWIQVYKNGDFKALHNHERYFPPVYKSMWSGAFYLNDGNPDLTKKYSGLFSFKYRGQNIYIKPKKGLMIMWQSDLLHEVHPFYGTEDRVVLNWNIVNNI